MSPSRLERSSNARLVTKQSIEDYCRDNKIDVTAASDCDNRILPDDLLKNTFDAAHAMQPLASTALQAKGASTILVFECKETIQGNESYHGEVVAAVAEAIGSDLTKGVEALCIHANANPNYRAAWDKDRVASVKTLIEDQGVPVIIHSLGWPDLELHFEEGRREQDEHFWRTTAFVVDSAGNGGAFQKHNIISHAPPLVVHVGAASYTTALGWQVEGYSSANSPTLLAPVAADADIVWKKDEKPGKITGTSVAAPYCGGVLAALNHRYGAYLTREQILFAVIATCIPITKVKASEPHTPQSKSITYQRNAAGLNYNAEYSGFGLIDPHRADHILSHMVELTQKQPNAITVPIEVRVKFNIKNQPNMKPDKNGLYHYELTMPEGYALKTTLEVDFKKHYGSITVRSPSGTEFPMILSQSPKKDSRFGLSTSHAWAGEKLDGNWLVSSTEPINDLRLVQHHFQNGDIVHQLNIKHLLDTPAPYLSRAIPLRDLGSEYAIGQVLNSKTDESAQRTTRPRTDALLMPILG